MSYTIDCDWVTEDGIIDTLDSVIDTLRVWVTL